MDNTYFFFNPFSKQYFFPKGFLNYKLFSNFYQPYTLKGKMLWKLWSKSRLLRWVCLEKHPEEMLPILNLQKYLPATSLLAFNRGTLGPEQKTTVLGVDQETGEQFFIKYAETEISQKNVKNEGLILKQLIALDYVPQLKKFVNTEEYLFIQTSVLTGEKVVSQNINQQLLMILTQLHQLKVESNNQQDTKLKVSFAHGDFCPWNMMLKESKLLLYDWEMAGYYPVGYDLFTYIFQTAFLLFPASDIQEIIKRNNELIVTFFKLIELNDWKKYLLEFVEVKLKIETSKNNKHLTNQYYQLKVQLSNRMYKFN